jgi:hypothetical protein
LFDVIDERWKKGAVFNLRRAFSGIKKPSKEEAKDGQSE